MTKNEQVLYDLFGFLPKHINYLINISQKFHYIYFETPKVGCSTIKRTLQQMETNDITQLPKYVHDKHLSPLSSPLDMKKPFTEYLTNEYFKFSFVRNPYTRILSCYLDKILGLEKNIIRPQLNFNISDDISFRDFLLAIKNQSYSEMNVHWLPQNILLGANNITLDFIGRQENLDNDLKTIISKIKDIDPTLATIQNEVPHAVGASTKLKEYLTEETTAIIFDIYYDDFLLYGYSKDPYSRDILSQVTIPKNEENRLVSIIIPCYNQAEYLEEAVQSAIGQTYKNIEIIIINDGSPDNTQKIAERLQRKHPDIIRTVTQENQGLSEARNAGIRESSGKYILPLDADDKIDKEMISRCLDTLISDQVDIVYTDIQCFDAHEETWRQRTSPFSIILYSNIAAATALYKREVWEKNSGYKLNMKEGYEDWEFWINAFENNFKFIHHSEALFFYRIKEESMHTSAKQTHSYLTSKIIMNHANLYTKDKVNKAISFIREQEKSADFYFYSTCKTTKDDEQIITMISSYIQNNTLRKKQTIDILNYDKQVGLCSLDILEQYENIEILYKELHVEKLYLYAQLPYEIFSFYRSNYAWSIHKGVIKSAGTIFPYTLQFKHERTLSQALAYNHLEIYTDYLEKKILNRETRIKKTKEELSLQNSIVHQFNTLTATITTLTDISFFTHPYKKIKAYKNMLTSYYTIKKEMKGS